MTPTTIAQIAHAANRAYCQSIGDQSQPIWEDAPDWQKNSAINGVNYHLDTPDAKPSDSHDKWLEEKRATGWGYGPVKDPEKKLHPCFVSYELLPQEQRLKDSIFIAIVHGMKPFLAPY